MPQANELKWVPIWTVELAFITTMEMTIPIGPVTVKPMIGFVPCATGKL